MHQTDILLQYAHNSLNQDFSFKSYKPYLSEGLWKVHCQYTCAYVILLCILKVIVFGFWNSVWICGILRLSPFEFKNIEIFKLPFSIGLSKLFYDSFKVALKSLTLFGKMVNIQEMLHTLNFKQFHFPMAFLLKVTFNTVSLKWSTLLHGFSSCTWSSGISNCFASWHPKCLLQCFARQVGKIIHNRFFMPLNLTILMSHSAKTTNRPLGCLRHSCTMLRLRKQIKLDCCKDKCITLSW